jgi:hypothetical protein
MSTKQQKRKTTKKPYSKGELNRLTDAILHPLYKKTELMRIFDGLVHGLIERDPETSAKKFVRYNARDIIKKILKNSDK